MSSSRRSFLKRSAAAVAAASAAACAPEGSRGGRPDGNGGSGGAAGARDGRTPPTPLPGETLRAVAEAVLPDELGEGGRERAVAAFERWADGIEPVAELAHPYLVPETRYSGPDPRPGWAAQLRGLDKESRSRHGAGLGGIGVPERRRLLRGPVGEAGPGLGAPANARHVAVALAAHFFASPGAKDMCYGRAIAKQQCRGLDGARDEPAALSAAREPSPARAGAVP